MNPNSTEQIMYYHIKAQNVKGRAFRPSRNDYWTITLNGQMRCQVYANVQELKRVIRDIINNDDKNPSKVSIRKG